MPRLSDLARLIRSKNAGPFHQTLDIMFDVPGNYQAVKQQNAITPERIAALYHRDVESVRVFFYDEAYAIKIAFPRAVAAGDIGNTDVFGAQQHAPLLDIEIKPPRHEQRPSK